MERRLLRPREVAEVLSVSERSVYRLLERHELPTVKVGESVRVDGQRLAQWIDAGGSGHAGGGDD